jgi:hypothetical protein
VRTARSLTVGGVSNPRLLAEPYCLGTGIKIGGPGDSVCASVENAAVGAWLTPTTGTTLNGEILNGTRLVQWNVGGKRIQVTHLVEVGSVSIDDGDGVRDKWKREDSFPLKDPNGLSLDMMIVKRESHCGLYEFALPTVHLGCTLHSRYSTTALHTRYICNGSCKSHAALMAHWERPRYCSAGAISPTLLLPRGLRCSTSWVISFNATYG